jgi:hypothetical protein
LEAKVDSEPRGLGREGLAPHQSRRSGIRNDPTSPASSSRRIPPVPTTSPVRCNAMASTYSIRGVAAAVSWAR